MQNEFDFIKNQCSSQASILIVDDVDDNLEILKNLLTFVGHEVQTARSGEEALQRVQDSRPDLILMDVLIAGMSGFELCARLKSRESTKNIPVIFVSSMSDIDSKVQGFKVGGVDYINKPYQHAEIVVRVNTHLTMLRLRQHLEKQNAVLERLANTDSLTNLYNRRSFFHVAESEFAEAIRNGNPISITLIDLDYFKQVNDTYGHLIGDQVLVHIARLIRMHSRIRDVAARYGGEEFIILHPSVDKHDAFMIVDRMRKGVEETPFMLAGNKIDVTLSAGVVDTQMCTACTHIDDMLRLADKALYRAKDAGRNQVFIFDGQVEKQPTHFQ